ncbi:AraC family transcriptional regulator [Maribacter algicola]|uniref:AraC family transcriptional regulator n=1 Tax=Maribacter algicola TaxID=2498892 RepID=A0A3R8Q1Z5_9FLAO|nr:AraC family transcriptional regulator [Maribacter algicola]RRQ50661.1 AraC family transcriptional regulator [Maribacter algicola]
MKFELTYEVDKVVKELVKRTMDSLEIKVERIHEDLVVLSTEIEEKDLKKLSDHLAAYGIKIQRGNSISLLEQIKSLIKRYVHGEYDGNVSISKMLSDELGYSYSYLSNHFTSKTFTTIENFYVLIRIEKVKELLMDEEKTLSDIAYSLNFSSVPHLSAQFKKVTGLTITQYLKIRNNSINTFN